MLNLDLLLDVSAEAEEQQQRAAGGGGPLLAAALAATLVEYRRQVGPRNAADGLAHAGANWRMVGRLEQLAR